MTYFKNLWEGYNMNGDKVLVTVDNVHGLWEARRVVAEFDDDKATYTLRRDLDPAGYADR